MQQEVLSCEECDAEARGSLQICKVHAVNKNAFGERRCQQMSQVPGGEESSAGVLVDESIAQEEKCHGLKRTVWRVSQSHRY